MAKQITLGVEENGISFTFDESTHYLYGDGKIVCPKNSLILVTDESEMFTLKKANGDVFLSARYDAVEGISSKEDLEEWFITNAVSTGGGSVDPETLAGLIADAEYISSATTIAFYNLDGDEVCHIDATAFVKDGMVDNVVISGNNLVITWNTSAGKQPISIPLSSIFDPSNYYDKSATDTLLNGKVAVSDYNTYTANTNTALSGKADVSAVTAVADSLSGKQDTLVYYSEDEDNGIATIKCGGDDEQHADIQVALGDATITAMDMPEEDKYEYEQIIVYTNQIELNQGKLEYNEELGEFEQVDYTHELTLNEDGIEINGDQIVTETALSDALSGKQDTLIAGSGITISGNVISADGGGGGMSEDDELLLATALVDLNDRKMNITDAKAEFAKYQKKGDYVTSGQLDTKLAAYETALDEQNVEEVASYALNDLNARLTTVETALGGLSLSAITQSQWATISGSANPSTIYIITNNE